MGIFSSNPGPQSEMKKKPSAHSPLSRLSCERATSDFLVSGEFSTWLTPFESGRKCPPGFCGEGCVDDATVSQGLRVEKRVWPLGLSLQLCGVGPSAWCGRAGFPPLAVLNVGGEHQFPYL